MKYTYLFPLLLVLYSLSATAQTTAAIPTLPAADHAKEVAAFQQELNAEYRNPAESPLPAKELKKFKGLPFFPLNRAARVEARFIRDSLAAPFEMETSTARRPMYRKYGDAYFTLEGQELKLTIYQSLDLLQKEGYQDYLFVPFTDRTNGHSSYGGGRYLDLHLGQIQNGKVVLDFNRAYNPFCAYGGQYSCPVPPVENRLPVAIKAGVMSDH
ncbi:DUF1684 domain-containing protein [Hymenobacter sp. HDW8]|uniref:DUF1684 domain-containing protein n=1 Tax=Hymenobacter sp. HDW8 TaxID=2714932 RepID=UPI001408FEAB|nr:DUF1684 domain-containing protein [Hymenobacter sp. HDW8]QIL76720.1 DUF1684 domain-containing protein [Hymenobacter sp. HDW8]